MGLQLITINTKHEFLDRLFSNKGFRQNKSYIEIVFDFEKKWEEIERLLSNRIKNNKYPLLFLLNISNPIINVQDTAYENDHFIWTEAGKSRQSEYIKWMYSNVETLENRTVRIVY